GHCADCSGCVTGTPVGACGIQVLRPVLPPTAPPGSSSPNRTCAFVQIVVYLAKCARGADAHTCRWWGRRPQRGTLSACSTGCSTHANHVGTRTNGGARNEDSTQGPGRDRGDQCRGLDAQCVCWQRGCHR